MPHIEFLKDLVIIFGLSIGIVLLFQRLHLPSIIGFLISGALLGPYGLNLIDEVEQVEILAEVGVVLLLFTIGLEFSLPRIARIKASALSGGTLQVGLTVAVTALLAWAIALSPSTGIFWGFLFALSSTAIVLKILVDRGEIDAPHGRIALGILIFQDLVMVPMMLLLPMLSGSSEQTPLPVLTTLARSLLVLAVLVVAARWLVPKALLLVVRSRSRELFVLTVILICLGIAWLASISGLSLALGAFIAGLMISESEYSHQALADIMPFRDSFNSLFFVSIGMLLDARSLIERPLVILSMVLLVFLFKGLIAGGSTLILGYPARVALLVGLSLAQVGEFSFVLARAGKELGLLTVQDFQLFLVISIISMIITPFSIQLGPRLSRHAEALRGFPGWIRQGKPTETEKVELHLSGHVIIAGYGLNGRNLARVLKESRIPYSIVDIYGETVRQARMNGEPIYFGDVAQAPVLRHLRIEEANVLVLALSDPIAVRRAIQVVRYMNPTIHIVVRTRYIKDVDELLLLGASEVVPEEFETSLEIVDLVLKQYQISRLQIARKKEALRREGHALMRREKGEPISAPSHLPAEIRIEHVPVKPDSDLIGKTIAELKLPEGIRVLVVAVLRGDQSIPNPNESFQIKEGDTFVLLGHRDELEKALQYLQKALFEAPLD